MLTHNKASFIKIIMLTAVFIAILLIAKNYRIVTAVFDSDDSVHIDPDEIKESTLIIGTHLIHLSAINDEIYNVASESAEDSAQSSMYYKSELADGKWYEISSAYSLSDIMDTESAVESEEIRQLFMTHHTKSDGVTYDLRTGLPVCIFDINDPHDLESMEELLPIKTHYDILMGSSAEERSVSEESNSEETEKENEKKIKRIRIFFETSTQTAEIVKCDEQIGALQAYYTRLKGREVPEENPEMVFKIMGKLNDLRKANILKIVEPALDSLGDDAGKLKADFDLTDAIADSYNNVTESLIECEGNALTKGDYVMTEYEYELSMELINQAGKNESACDLAVEKLVNLSHIMDGNIISGTGELEVLEKLIPDMEVRIKNSISTQDENLEVKFSELQFYVQSKVDRLEKDIAIEYLKKCLEEAPNFKTLTVARDFKAKANKAMDQYIEWLKSLLSDFEKGNSQSELIDLYEQKEALQTEALSALDNNDVDKAKQIQAQIDALSEKINTKQNAVQDELNSLLKQKSLIESELNISNGNHSGNDDGTNNASDDEDNNASYDEDNNASDDEDNNASDDEDDNVSDDEDNNASDDEGNNASDGGALSSNSDLASRLGEIERQIAILKAELPEDGELKSIQDMSDHALKLLDKDDTSSSGLEGIGSSVEGLGAMLEGGSKTAKTALESIHREMVSKAYLSNEKSYDELIDRAEELIIEHADVTNKNALTREGIINALENILGEDILNVIQNPGLAGESIDTDESNRVDTDESNRIDTDTTSDGRDIEDELAGTIIALAECGEASGNKEMEHLADSMSQAVLGQGLLKGRLFRYLSSMGNEFLPVSVLASNMEYRYLWSDTKKTAMIARGADYYSFTAFQKHAYHNGEDKKEMDSASIFKGEVHIPFSFAEEEFECQIYVIGDSGFAMIVDSDIIERNEEIVNELQGQEVW